MPASMKGVIVILLDAVTSGTGVGVAIPITSESQRVTIRGTGTITGGTVVIEEASNPDYTGTWSNINTTAASEVTGNAEKVIHITGTVGAIRARVTVNITGGGNITVELVSE